MSVRINARLDVELERKLAYLQARTGKSATEVVRASLENYFEFIAGSSGTVTLLDGLVGCSSGDADLSTTYKAALGDSVRGKHALNSHQGEKRSSQILGSRSRS